MDCHSTRLGSTVYYCQSPITFLLGLYKPFQMVVLVLSLPLKQVLVNNVIPKGSERLRQSVESKGANKRAYSRPWHAASYALIS